MNGYKYIQIQNKHYFQHRLIAKAFISNENNKPFINHINGNKGDNTLSNLQWCSRSENVQHAHDNGLISINNHRNPIIQCDLKGNEIKRFDSAKLASEELNGSYHCILRACNEEQYHSMGFRWKFA